MHAGARSLKCTPTPPEKLPADMAANDIYGGVHYKDNTEYRMYSYAQGTCPKAHEVSRHIITLPLHMWLTDDDVRKIIEVVNNSEGL